MKKWMLLSIMLGAVQLSVMAQDDDMYYVPTKASVAKDKASYGVPRDTYYSGSSRSVDEYNRRGSSYEVLPADTGDIISFSAVEGVYPDSVGDFAITRKMQRWDGYEPSDSYWEGYYQGRRDSWGWHSPWYYSSFYPWYDYAWGWYDPWYDPWYYGSWRYGWYDPWYSWRYGWGWGGYYNSWWYRPSWYYGWYGGYYGSYHGGYAYNRNTIGAGTMSRYGNTRSGGHVNSDGVNTARNRSANSIGARRGSSTYSPSRGSGTRSYSSSNGGFGGGSYSSSSSRSSSGGSVSSGGGFGGGGGRSGGSVGGGSRSGGGRR